MRCDAMPSQCPTGGGGDRNIRIIDADSSFGGGPQGGRISDLGGRWPPQGPPSSPAPARYIMFLFNVICSYLVLKACLKA